MSVAIQSAAEKLTIFAGSSIRSGYSNGPKIKWQYNQDCSHQPNNQQKHDMHSLKSLNGSQLQQVQSRPMMTTLALIVLVLMLVSTVEKVRANSLAAALNSLQGGQHNQIGSYGHYDEQQLVKKFMPELILQAQTDRSLERALLNLLMNQQLYNMDESQQQLIGSLPAESRVALHSLESIGTSPFSGYDPGKRSYWKQCAVNAVSCFGRRKRR